MKEHWISKDDSIDRIMSHRPLGTKSLGTWTQVFDAKDVRAKFQEYEDRIAKLNRGGGSKIKDLENKLSICIEQRDLEIAMRIANQEEIEIQKKHYDSLLDTGKIFIVRGFDEEIK